MRTMVWKFPLVFNSDVPATAKVEMPEGAEIVHVGLQGEVPTAWALVDPEDKRRVTRTFWLVGTGHGMPVAWEHVFHQATIFPTPGLVFHIFEVVG